MLVPEADALRAELFFIAPNKNLSTTVDGSFSNVQSCGEHISVHPCMPVWMYMVLEVTELFLTSWVINLLRVTMTKAVNYQTLTLLVLAGH
jgi:hypothetical protein